MIEIASYLQLDTLLYRVLAFLLASTLYNSVSAYTTSLLGDRTAREQGRLSFNPAVHITPLGLAMVLFGPYGFTKSMPIDPRRFKKSSRLSSVIVWLAPALANLLIGVLFWFIHRMILTSGIDVSTMGQFWSQFVQFSMIVNLMYAFLHLIPLYPLGGWYALRSFLGLEPYNSINRANENAAGQEKSGIGRRFSLWEIIGLCFVIFLMVVPLGRWLLGQIYVILERWISIIVGI